MNSPCDGCEHQHLSKSIPFIWLQPEQTRTAKKNRTPKLVPGKNIRNPCWMCDRAIDYADDLSQRYVGPPSSWPDGVTEHPVDQVEYENLRIY